MTKYRAYGLLVFFLLCVPRISFADNYQPMSTVLINYLQWENKQHFPYIDPPLLTVVEKIENEYLQSYINNLSSVDNYQGYIALPQKNSIDGDSSASFILLSGDGYTLLNMSTDKSLTPLLVEKETNNPYFKKYLDHLQFRDNYQGFIHLPPENSVNGDSYIVLEGDNYYLINLFAEEYVPSLTVEQETDNPYLQKYIEHLPKPENYRGFMHLPKHNRAFDSYIVMEWDKQHLVNILDDGTLFSQPNIVRHWNQDEQQQGNHWTVYTIDESLNLKVTEAIIHYSELQKKFLITRKINEQRYRVNDMGDINEISNKYFPQVVTDYDPTNPDNCLNTTIQSNLSSYSGDLTNGHFLPLPFSFNYVFHPDIDDNLYEPEGLGFNLDCYTTNGFNVLFPPKYQYYVVLFTGYGADYLVISDSKGKISDTLMIDYEHLYENGNKQSIRYIINRDYSIDLTMTEPDGNVVKQTFSINQQGEFE